MKYKICSRCGAQMEIEEGVICTSIPPMFRYKCPVCGGIEFDLDKYPMLVLDSDKNFGSVAPPFFFDWQAFRAEAAKDILCSILSTRDSADEEHIQMAVEIADSLIAKLKGDGTEV